MNQSLSRIGPDEIIHAYQLLIGLTRMTGLSPFVIDATSMLVKQNVLNTIKIQIHQFIFSLICYSKQKILKFYLIMLFLIFAI